MEDELELIAAENRRSNRAYEKRLEELLRQATAELPRLVEAMRRIDPGLRRVVLFGSLARNDVRNQDFDIDLAVSSGRILRIAAWSEDQALPLDVVDLDSMDPDFRGRVEGEGKLLYEKTHAG
jgi:predicted nucleotidyltransferase